MAVSRRRVTTSRAETGLAPLRASEVNAAGREPEPDHGAFVDVALGRQHDTKRIRRIRQRQVGQQGGARGLEHFNAPDRVALSGLHHLHIMRTDAQQQAGRG